MFAFVGIDYERVKRAHIDAETGDVFYLGVDRERHIAVNGQQQVRNAAFVGEFFAEIFFGEKYCVALHKFYCGKRRF